MGAGKRAAPRALVACAHAILAMCALGTATAQPPPPPATPLPDISLWIDARQVKLFSGISMEIYVISNGSVSPYVLDPNFSHQLPVIPSEVSCVNFTWAAPRRKYLYNFDALHSAAPHVLRAPTLSIPARGRVPRRPKEFSIFLACMEAASGIAQLDIGLELTSGRGRGAGAGAPLRGTPLRLRLNKECAHRGPDPECDRKCANEGWCNSDKMCQCPEGYMGPYCRTALCYPQCMNGGNCTAPGLCSCPHGYQGRHCEGGICAEKCQNGGKCIQKDTCECPKGYYGLKCEFSKCVIPCLNGGRCKGVNKCRCGAGLAGNHCEVWRGAGASAGAACARCHHGACERHAGDAPACACEPGWHGRYCNTRQGSSEEWNEAKRPR